MQNRWKSYGRTIFRDHFEWMALGAGLLLIATTDPAADTGFTWCLLEWAGTPWCPGEGLGHAVAHLFRGNVEQSLSANVLGLPAVIVLTGRIGHLVRIRLKGNNNGSDLWRK